MSTWLPDRRGLPRAFAWLWVGTLVNRTGSFVGPFLAIYLRAELNMTIERIGVVLAAVGVGSSMSGPLGGALADRIGRRKTMALATLLGAAAMLALAFARGAGAVTAAGFALGLFGEMYRPAVAAIVADIVLPEHRQNAYGLLHWAVNLGFSIAPVVAGLVSSRGFALLFALDAATTLLFGALVVAAVPETRPGPSSGAGAGAARPSLVEPYTDRLFLAFLAASTLLAVVFLQGHVAMPLDLRAHGVTPRAFGLLLAVNGALIVVFQPFVTARIRRMPRGRVLAAGALVTGIGWGLNGLANGGVGWYVAAIVVWTMGEMAMAPVIAAFAADVAPRALRGTYQGAYQLTFGAATVVAPLLGSLALRTLGSAALWGSCVAFGGVAALAYAVVVPRAERRRSVSR